MYISHYKKSFRNTTVFNNPCSLYNGVLVIWDDDFDDRIFDFIDSMQELDREMLLACSERKGMLELIWKRDTFIPTFYNQGNYYDVATDTWYIQASVYEE